MNAAVELIAQYFIDHAVALDAAFSAKSLSRYCNAEMAFAPRAIAGMPQMALRLIGHFEREGSKCPRQFLPYAIADSHRSRKPAVATKRLICNVRSNPVKSPFVNT